MAVYTAAELNASETLGTTEAEIFTNSNKIIIKQIYLQTTQLLIEQHRLKLYLLVELQEMSISFSEILLCKLIQLKSLTWLWL